MQEGADGARRQVPRSELLDSAQQLLLADAWPVHWQRQEEPAAGARAVCEPGGVLVVGATGLEVVVGHEGSGVVVAAFGDIDERTGPCLSAVLTALQDAGARDVVVDLGGASSLDPVGAGILAGALYRSAGRLSLRDVPEQPRQALELSGLVAAFREDGSPDLGLVREVR